MSRAAVHTVLFFFLAPGTMGFVVPWVITGWQRPEGELGALDLLGAALVACGLVAVVACFVRFVREGSGTPAPVEPTESLVVGGLYRYVRNPMYIAVASMIGGQALIFHSNGVLVWLAAVHVVGVELRARVRGADARPAVRGLLRGVPRRGAGLVAAAHAVPGLSQATTGTGSFGWSASVRAPERSAPIPAATTKATPTSASGPGTCASTRTADAERDRGLQAHQGAERRGGQATQREQLEGERDDGQQQRHAEADQPELGVHPAERRRAGHAVATSAATGIETARPVIPATSSPTFWVSRMYAAQQQAAASANSTPDRVGAAVPGLGQQQHAGRREQRPQRSAPGVRAPGDRHRERPEELQGAGHAEREPGQRRHEQQRDAGRDHAEQHAGHQRPPGEVRAVAAARAAASARRPRNSRSQAAPSAPSRSISPTETARPIWTLSMAVDRHQHARASGRGRDGKRGHDLQ